MLCLAVVLAMSLDAGPAGRPQQPSRLGVVSFHNPRLTYVKYQPLADYLTEQTGRPWELSVSTSYEDAVENLCAGRVSVAYVGPFSYVRARERCGVEPLVRLRTGGLSTYRAYVLVHADSDVESLEDLDGRRVGFGASASASSHLVPRAMLAQAGLRPGTDVECRYYDHHEQAVRAVLMGEVDACGVRDLVGRIFLQRGLRRLARSEPIPNPPIIAGPATPEELREAVRDALLRFPDGASPPPPDEEWEAELAGGFAPSTDSDYDPVRELARRVLGPAAVNGSETELRCQ